MRGIFPIWIHIKRLSRITRGSLNPFQVEFELKLPLVVKDKVTDEDVRENIKNILSEIPIISDIQFDEEDVLVEGNIWPLIKA